jgi:hypothetical protein
LRRIGPREQVGYAASQCQRYTPDIWCCTRL